MRPSLTCSLSCRRRWPLSALAASLVAALGLDASAAEPASAPERASAWLLRQPAERYGTGAFWQVHAEKPAQQALRNQVVDGLRALPLDRADGLPRLADWVAGLPITGRAALGSADPRWLEVHPDQDPVLRVGESLDLPERPRTVTVVLENGERCRVPARSGVMAFDYLRACVTDASDRDVVWIAQPDGRTYRYGTGLWNGEAQDPPAAGAWIWAPKRQSRIPASLSDALIRLLATQGVAPDSEGYSVPPVAGSLPEGAVGRSSVRQRDLPLTASDWGEIGLLQTPTARMEAAGDARLSINRTTPYTRATVMFQPLDWLEFGFRYISVSGQPYGLPTTSQSYKDKNVDVKVRLWEESRYLPGIAVGARDIGGTGLFSGEYVVASKRTGNFDWSLGMGWGYLGARGNLKNPLSFISDRFSNRPGAAAGETGLANATSYFRGPTSLFGGVQWHSPFDPLIVKLEYDGNNYQREPFSAKFRQRVPVNVGVVYRYSPNIDIAAGVERGDKISFGITFHGGLDRMSAPKLFDTPAPSVQAARPVQQGSWNDLSAQMNQDTGWRVTQAVREGDTLRVSVSGAGGLYRSGHFDRLVAYLHRDSVADVNRFVIDFVEHGMVMGSKTIDRAEWVALQTEARSPAERRALGGDVPTEPLASIVPRSEPARAATAAPAASGAKQDAGFWRSADDRFSGGLGPSFWQTLGGPDSFMLYQIGIKGDAEYRLTRSTWVNASANLRVIDNYDKFKYTAPSNLPRVRTYAREYVTTSRFTVSNLQLTHAEQLGGNHFASVYGGLLEPMFGGVGAEYLYRPLRSRWAFGVDVNRVRQRAFEQNFSFRDYQVTTGHATIYWDTGWNGVNVRVSAGQYLAGDRGATLDLSRRFSNGVVIGAYATKTNVSAAQFGEGSFDKGLYVSFPFDAILPRSTPTNGTIFWTPLTRDGGARLARTQTLYSVTSTRALDAFSAGPPREDRLRSGDDVFTPRKD